jgi:hypothetical protein
MEPSPTPTAPAHPQRTRSRLGALGRGKALRLGAALAELMFYGEWLV